MIKIRSALAEDLPFLTELEEDSFPDFMRSSRRSMLNSITSYHQKVWVAEAAGEPVGAAVAFLRSNSLRIYSIASSSSRRGAGVGAALMNHLIEYAGIRAFSKIVLEADADNIRLVEWYKSCGFVTTKTLPDFYATGRSAYRMEKPLVGDKLSQRHIVVVDEPQDWLNGIDSIEVVDVKDYITADKYQKSSQPRIFNLCSSYAYQSMGYYVSLLASARKQRVIPNVATIKDFTDSVIAESIADDFYDEIQRAFKAVKDDSVALSVYFGTCSVRKYQPLVRKIYKLFEAPFVEFVFERHEKAKDWALKSVTPITVEAADIGEEIIAAAQAYFAQKKFTISRFKDYKYNLAILTDPSELTPPSCRMALKNFFRAAEKIGFYTEFITKEDYSRLTEFDALFIRTTTNVNDYTYQFSRYAYAEGLAVIDDPWSILKCANKIYLSENMKKEGVRTPKTLFLVKGMDYSRITEELDFPIVLKEPDNAFCLGVFKVNNMAELTSTLERVFEKSKLILAQQFVRSDFDWRIGVLDNAPLFACKYYMADKHWQISKWNKDRSNCLNGRFETFPIASVPKDVIKTAIKAAAAMGDGLYGVDLKEVDGKVYVIEVNDNPNIDFRVEDRILKKELYSKVMYSLYRRLERSAGKKRYVSNEYR